MVQRSAREEDSLVSQRKEYEENADSAETTLRSEDDGVG